MKVFVAIAFLVVALTDAHKSYYPCYKAGHFPDPYNCEAFIQCDDFGKAFHKYCPKGTLFNAKIGVCDHESNVYCGPLYGHGYIAPLMSYKSCYKSYPGHFPDPYNCNAFIQCDNHGNGFHLYCPKGLHFNPRIGVCDYPSNVYCKYNSYGHKYTHHYGTHYNKHYQYCKKNHPGHFADSHNCKAFIQCDNFGNAFHLYCPKGLVFNPISSVCDYPKNVANCHKTY